MHVLLVDDEQEILEILSEFLEIKGHQVTTATNGLEALNILLDESDIDVVFSDIKMPEMDGLTLLEKTRHNDIDIPVILISGQGDLGTTIRALKLGALDFIVKPVHLKSVAEALDRIQAAVSREMEVIDALEQVTLQEIHVTMESNLQNISRQVSFFKNRARELGSAYNLDNNKIAICLQESLTNAIIHGNFAISSKMKEDDWNAFDALVKERESSPDYRAKKVTIAFRHDSEGISFEVSDEGKGFDPSNLPDPTDPASWLRLSGRGIMFIRSYMDQVSWNETGNSIRMVKLFQR